MLWNCFRRPLRVACALAFAIPCALAATDPALAQDVTSPEEEFGQPLGSDYFLATYQQLIPFWQKLASESDRMVLDTIGYTEEGRPHLMAIITSPENHGNLARYQEIARRMAHAGGVDEQEARRLAQEGKAVIWIDGGLHATEVLGAQQLMEFVYQMVSRSDDETLRILDDVIVLAAHANPDGHDLVADWYMREPDPLKRSTQGIPVLYQKYAGHDNNRDFYMSNLAETTNMNRVIAREWFPQIVYNHHQTGPSGTVMFAPPFRDPPNHNLDPLIITGLDRVGSAMHQRFVLEGKGGTTMRSGASYSTWWNGGLRTTPYFKNQIGLLTETIGNPTPIEIPFVPRFQLPSGDIPLPIEPQTWHFRSSIDYSQTANRAVLDYASRNSDHLLFNIWRMGMNSIERGSRDHWTTLPKEIDAAMESAPSGGGRFGGARMTRADWERMLRSPEDRDARGYVLSADQADFSTATRFVNALLKNGVAVHEATAAFTVDGTRYPAGSYVVKTDQAFRPHVLDMFEPQDHPNDFPYPGAPPTAPYDNAGWTLAYQMGVEFDRILDGFDGPFRPIEDLATAPAGSVAGEAGAGYIVSHEANDAFAVVNRLLEADKDVFWLTEPATLGQTQVEAGTFFVPNGRGVREILRTAAEELGIDVTGVPSRPSVAAIKLNEARIGLWDRYGGSMPSGWTRFVLEQFEFPYRLVYPQELDEGNLKRKFDVLIFPDGAISDQGRGGFGGQRDPESIPEEFRDRLGSVSAEGTVPELRDFLEDGGTIITIGTSTSLGMQLGLPITDHLIDPETGDPLASEQYYVPGSVVDLKLEHRSPLLHGMGERANVLFSRSPVFEVDRSATNVRVLGWFDTDEPLRSGWAWGQSYLKGGAGLLEADVGQGKLFLFGPKVTFRGQSHQTFKLLFNGILYGSGDRPRTVSDN